MAPEVRLLLETLDHAFAGKGWHGTTLSGSLRGMTPAQALKRPARGRHCIWEIVLHTAYWKYAVWCRLTGARPPGGFPRRPSNWPAIPRPATQEAWRGDVRLLKGMHGELRKAVAGLSPQRLATRTPSGADEYQTVRTTAGLFDVSHMGRIEVSGAGALVFLQTITTNDVAALQPMHAQYSMVCNRQGGIKDDICVYRLAGPNEYLLCVNASNRDKIHSWLLEQGAHVPGCRIHDRSAEIAQIALQGPATRAVVATFGSTALDALKLRESTMVTIESVPCLVARTGYTGEFGYEFYVYGPPAPVWNALLDRGQSVGVKPAGLGARDLLRRR